MVHRRETEEKDTMLVEESARGPSFGFELNAETEVSAKKGKVQGKQSNLRSILYTPSFHSLWQQQLG